MDVVEVGGLRIAYERVGAGPAVVLLHGYVADGRTTWRWQLDGLSDEFTVVAWDAPGTGGSSDPPEGFGTAGYADCLAGFIDALRLEHPSVLGLSFGGILALALHDRHPTVARGAHPGVRLRRLGRFPTRGRRGGTTAAGPRTRRSLARPCSARRLLPTMFAPARPRRRRSAHGRGLFRASMLEFHPVGFRAMARAFLQRTSAPSCPRSPVPTLLVDGENDVRAGLSVARGLEVAIGGARLAMLPAAVARLQHRGFGCVQRRRPDVPPRHGHLIRRRRPAPAGTGACRRTRPPRAGTASPPSSPRCS